MQQFNERAFLQQRYHEITGIKSKYSPMHNKIKICKKKILSLFCLEQKHMTDIHILMLGASWAAKSSAGNVILDKDVFEVNESRTTVSCAVGNGKVHGRKLTVVDTPGWYCHSLLEKTSVIDKLEIRCSVSLCPPGPHVILLTVPIAIAFNKSYQIAVEEHMGLLGKKVWNHTIVLFTRGDWLGDTTIEERIEIEGEHLEWLMEQCGNRYHVFNCKDHTDSTQVTELLEKIEEMVMINNGCHYAHEIENNPTIELDMKLKIAKTNMLKVKKKRDILQVLQNGRYFFFLKGSYNAITRLLLLRCGCVVMYMYMYVFFNADLQMQNS